MDRSLMTAKRHTTVQSHYNFYCIVLYTYVLTKLHCWITRWQGEVDRDDRGDAETALAFFPNIHTCLKLVCALGVTSAECERRRRRSVDWRYDTCIVVVVNAHIINN